MSVYPNVSSQLQDQDNFRALTTDQNDIDFFLDVEFKRAWILLINSLR